MSNTAEIDEELCNHCGEWRPESSFRVVKESSFRVVKESSFRVVTSETGRLAPTCNDCRREQDRIRKAAKRQKQTLADLQSLRRCRSLSRVDVVLNAMIHRKGIRDLIHRWLAVLDSPTATETQRLSVVKTFMHLCLLRESQQVQEKADNMGKQPKRDSIAETLDEWHRAGKLAPVLQIMHTDGRLSFDDIDPPPDKYFPK